MHGIKWLRAGMKRREPIIVMGVVNAFGRLFKTRHAHLEEK
jgi:hypothetical protein